MKSIKKLLALTLACAAAASLAACGSSAPKQTASSGASGDASAAGTDAGKTYLIATDTTFAPFEFQNESGEFVGIDMDLLKAIAEDQGFSYEIQVLGFDAAVQSLQAGQSDAVIAGMSITPERQDTFDFSEP